ncbi:MAG: hypothetical protein AB7M05_07025 [Alphaproteobacteria bacterium]
MERDEREPEREEAEARSSLAGLLIAILLVIGGIYLMLQMRDNAKLQDCVASGRRNCVPVELPAAK